MLHQSLFNDPTEQPTDATLAERLGAHRPLWSATVEIAHEAGVRCDWSWDETARAWGYRAVADSGGKTVCTFVPHGDRIVAALDLTGREVLRAEDNVESGEHQDMIAEMKPVKRIIGDKKLDAIYEVPFYRTDDLPVLRALLTARLARRD